MSKEAMKLALEALEELTVTERTLVDIDRGEKAITALREALAEQPAQQEPVAWMFEDNEDNGHKTFRQTPPSPEAVAYLAKWNRPAWVPLYTSPPAQRTWVGLTDEEVTDIWAESSPYYHEDDFARAIEAKLRSKNEDRI